VDGLKDEIRVVVLVHQPKDLDAAVSLALLQEEAWEIWKHREPHDARRFESASYSKGGSRMFTGAPSATERDEDKRGQEAATERVGAPPTSSPSTYAAPRATLTAEDKRGQEAARESPTVKLDDRAAALKSYRRSRGLCFVCGEKWSPGHQCAATVQLHVVQETIDAMGFDLLEFTGSEPDAPSELLALSSAAMNGSEAPSTFRLVGQIQKQQVLMLVD
jgi:hypothetical protein